jgi:hypothetical protein
MESSVDTHAVEHPVQNMARDKEMTRTFLMNISPFDFRN